MATYREAGSQMQRVDLHIDNKRDVEIKPRRYFTAEDLLNLKKLKAVEIQRYWRGYMARCRALSKKKFIDDWELAQDEKTLRALEDLRASQAMMQTRRKSPKSKADFASLYNELDTWRKDQTEQIKQTTKPGEERNLRMMEVLAHETKALQSIRLLKGHAYTNTYETKTQQMLELMAQPERWQMSDGNIAAVQTPETIRAAKLYEDFKELNEPFTVDSRLETLLRIKTVVK